MTGKDKEIGAGGLPRGWAKTTLGSVLTVLRGVSYDKQHAVEAARNDINPALGLVPVLRANNIGDGALNFDGIVYVPPQFISNEQLLQVGDIVLAASSGSVSVVGKAAPLLHKWHGSFGAFCYGLRVHRELNSQYVSFFLQTKEYRNKVSELASGVNINNLRRNHIEDTSFRVAPLAEQKRIVAEIERQFSLLDAGVANLKQVRVNLKRYRASILQAACTGKLVPTEHDMADAEGRAYEPASELLARILTERRARWEADQRAKMQAAGKAPKDDRWKARYEEPAPPDTSDLPELPQGWTWTALKVVAALAGGVTKGQQRRPGEITREVPYLRVANVQRGYLDLREVKTIVASESEIAELRLVENDILFNEGGDRDKLGRGWIWSNQIEDCVHQNHVFRARLFSDDVQAKFISFYGNSVGSRYFMDEGKQTTNLASINMTKLGNLPIPLPPAAEQERIVAEVERRLSVVEALETTVAHNLKRAERLRQAVLRDAFTGKLVPQDLTDEPASVLLARIEAERQVGLAKNRASRNKRQEVLSL